MTSNTQYRIEDAVRRLDIKNGGETIAWTCVGLTKKGQRCQNSANKANRTAGLALLSNLSRGTRSEDELRQDLYDIARYLLCLHYHQYQAEDVATRWFHILTRSAEGHTAGASPSSTGGVPGPSGTNHHQDQGSQQRSHQNAGSRPSAYNEPRSRSDSECARRQAEAQASAEAENRERQRRYRGQQEATRQRREQEESQRQQQERRTWEAIWRRYFDDWEKMSRISTVDFDESVKHSIPWPVKSGRWQHVTPDNVREFFRNAPDGAYVNLSKLRSLLRRETLRWHEDKIRQKYPRIAGDREALQLTVVVMQVINEISERLRH